MTKILNDYLKIEKIFRFSGIVMAVFIYIFSPHKMNIFTLFFFFLATLLMTLLITNRTSENILEKNPLMATFDAIFLILCLMFTGKSQSPFMIYMFGNFLTLARLLKTVSTAIYSSILLIFILTDVLVRNPQAFLKNSPLIIPFTFGVALLTTTISYFLSRFQDKKSLENAALKETVFQPSETLLDYIWDVADLQRDMQKSYSMDNVISLFIQFLKRLDLTGAVVIHFKKNDLAELFLIKNDSLETIDLNTLLPEETNLMPSDFKITHEGRDYEFAPIAENPEVTIYIPPFSPEEDRFKFSLLKLASELFAYRIAEMTLQSKEKIFLSRFSSLHEAVKKFSNTIEPQPILNAAAQAVKGLTGMEKSLVMLASTPEEVKLDFSKTVIKGKVAEHPEDSWKDALIEAGKKCLSELEPVLIPLANGKSHMVCVPMTFREKILGLIAGISSLPKEEVLSDLRTMEIIAALAATSITNLELLKQREKAIKDEEKSQFLRRIYEKLLLSLYEALLEVEKAIGVFKKDKGASLKNLHSLKAYFHNLIGNFRKYVFEHYPEAQKTIGFKSTIEKVINSFNKPLGFFQLSIEVPVEIPVDIENALMRIVYEASSNSIFHGEATTVEISIKSNRKNIELVVKDNGHGFSPKDAIEKINEERKLGIRSMFESVKTLGGNLQIMSAPGKGTVVKATIPLELSR